MESEGLLFKKNMHGRVNAALKTIRLLNLYLHRLRAWLTLTCWLEFWLQYLLFSLPTSFPLQWLSNHLSLLQASLKTTLSFYIFPVWILFFFHSWHLYSLPPDLLREHQVSFYFFTFASWLSSFLLLISQYCFNDYSELGPLVHIQMGSVR